MPFVFELKALSIQTRWQTDRQTNEQEANAAYKTAACYRLGIFSKNESYLWPRWVITALLRDVLGIVCAVIGIDGEAFLLTHETTRYRHRVFSTALQQRQKIPFKNNNKIIIIIYLFSSIVYYLICCLFSTSDNE